MKKTIVSAAVAKEIAQKLTDLQDKEFNPSLCTVHSTIGKQVKISASLSYRTGHYLYQQEGFLYQPESYPTGGILLTATTTDYLDKPKNFTRRLGPGWTSQQVKTAVNNLWCKTMDFHHSQQPIKTLYAQVEAIDDTESGHNGRFVDAVLLAEKELGHNTDYTNMSPDDVSFWSNFVIGWA